MKMTMLHLNTFQGSRTKILIKFRIRNSKLTPPHGNRRMATFVMKSSALVETISKLRAKP